MRLQRLIVNIVMQAQSNGQQIKQGKSINTLAYKVVNKLFVADSPNTLSLQQLCKEFKNKKVPQQKIANNFANELHKIRNQGIQLTIDSSVNKIINLGLVMDKVGDSEAHIQASFNGFVKYWMSLVVGFNVATEFTAKQILSIKKFNKQLQKNEVVAGQLLSILKSRWCEFHRDMTKNLANFLLELANNIPSPERQEVRKYFCSQILKMNPKLNEGYAYLIHFFSLQQMLPHKIIPQILLSTNIQKTYLALISYPFQKPCKELIEEYTVSLINKQKDKGADKVKKLINILNLNPFDYQLYIRSLNEKCLGHFLREQQVFFTELKINHRQDLLESFTKLLMYQNRQKQATHFINKYHLKQFYGYRGDNQKYMKNILNDKDQFCPTELILNRNAGKYISLKKFGYSEQSIKFIDDHNFLQSHQQFENIRHSGILGIDTESVPVFNCHEKRETALLQIATSKNVYLLDILNLKKVRLFKKWYYWLITEYRGKMIGVSLEKQMKELFQEIQSQENNLDQQIGKQQTGEKDERRERGDRKEENGRGIEIFMKDLQLISIGEIEAQIKAETADISTFYRRKYPKEAKSSLKYISENMFDSNLSKYEQCSGWHVRPLRKSQIHYAALDAVLPAIIYEQLRTK